MSTEAQEAQLLPPSEAAREKDCSRQTIYNALDRGDLNGLSFKPPGRVRRTRLVKVDAAFQAWHPKETGGRVASR
jgi:hypothetical protein